MLPEIAKEWIDKAEEDYGFACAGIECTDYFLQICFHFQQAGRKSILKHLQLPKAWNLEPFITSWSYWKFNPGLEELREACRFLNPFYIDTRCPVHWPAHYDKDTAAKAKEMAANIKNWIKKTLNV